METIKIADLSTEKVIHRIPVCLETICIDDGDENKLTCAKCKQKQHYYCTGLPTYQISIKVYRCRRILHKLTKKPVLDYVC